MDNSIGNNKNKRVQLLEMHTDNQAHLGTCLHNTAWLKHRNSVSKHGPLGNHETKRVQLLEMHIAKHSSLWMTRYFYYIVIPE